MTYPSGRPMPKYGPTTDEEMITDGLEWAYAMLVARDQMNAAVHATGTRLSPVTIKVQTALGLWRKFMDSPVEGETGNEPPDLMDRLQRSMGLPPRNAGQETEQ